MKIQFTTADLELFAAASHDRNPLHLAAQYGRRSQFGRQVVYGALSALAMLGKLPAPAPERRLASMTLEFSRAVFLDTAYQIVARADGAVLMDGTTKVMKITWQFTEGSAWSPTFEPTAEVPKETPARLGEAELVAGLVASGQYCPAPQALFSHLGLDVNAWGGFALCSILWASYVVGMEVPGERALFYRYVIQLDEPKTTAGVLRWQMQVKGRNALNLVRSDFQLNFGGQPAGNGQIDVLLRPIPVTREFEFPKSNELAGKIALVTGASRGFGAALTRALVWRGGHVLAAFQQSLPEAERLRDELAVASGSMELVQGDASDLAWANELKARYPQLDFLIMNACPTVLGMKAEAESVERLNAYVSRAFELVSVPLSVFGRDVRDRCVLISSIYVETLPKEFPHYVAAKAAAEAMLRAVAKQHKRGGYLIVRPPKLLTDMTNTPYGSEDAIAPEELASRVVERLCQPYSEGEVELL